MAPTLVPDVRGVSLAGGDCSSPDAGGDRLLQLCTRLLAIASTDSESVGPAPRRSAVLWEELASIVEGGIREVTAKLKCEFARWEAAAEKVEQLERLRYLALPERLRAWTVDFVRAKEQAKRIIEALTDLAHGDHFRVDPLQRDREPSTNASQSPRLRVGRSEETAPVRALVGWVEASRPTEPVVGLKDSTLPTKQSDEGAKPIPAVSIPAKKRPLAPVGITLSLDCPSCGAGGAVRCDRLGRLQVCRRCARSFRVDATGGLVEVVKRNDGRWVDKHAHQKSTSRSRALRLLGRRVLPALVLVGAVLLAYRLMSRPAPAQQPDLPADLQPRVELFTKAWLQKDWSLMRRFAAPGEDRALYNWFVRHPPPANGLGDSYTRLEVVHVSTQAQPTTVKVRIGTGEGMGARSPVDVLQFWREHEAGWFFAPEGTSSGPRASAGPAVRSK